MAKVLFINVQDIKSKGIIGENTDEKIIAGSLLEVQEMELEPLIGKPLYKALSDGITNENLTDAQKGMLTEVIKPYLVYGTLLYSVVPLHFKLNNKGSNKSTDSNLQLSSTGELDSFKNYYKEKFDSYKRRLIEYFATDNNPETNTDRNEDTTASILGIHLPDVTDYSAEYANSRAYKTNYYRRN